VRVPDEMLKCVGFVCEVTHKDSTGEYGDAYATGFFVSVRCEDAPFREKRHVYFVTAKHVADDLKDREIFFLVNKKGGGTTDKIGLVDNQWTLHPEDMTADLAVVQVVIHPTADIMPIALESIGLPDKLNQLRVGIGDETHTIGLFSQITATKSHLPIVRSGNIAMMPTEQIQTEYGYADVYLIEARSLGGMSGSPVFVQPTYRKKAKLADGTETVEFSKGPGETLLGIMHGHWSIRESDINKPTFVNDRKTGVNYGVAIVVPAYKLYETINRPELVQMRKEQEEKTLRSTIPSPDRPDKKEEEAVFTQADFDAALTKVTRRVDKTR
jgi:hypothetical protein